MVNNPSPCSVCCCPLVLYGRAENMDNTNGISRGPKKQTAFDKQQSIVVKLESRDAHMFHEQVQMRYCHFSLS